MMMMMEMVMMMVMMIYVFYYLLVIYIRATYIVVCTEGPFNIKKLCLKFVTV